MPKYEAISQQQQDFSGLNSVATPLAYKKSQDFDSPRYRKLIFVAACCCSISLILLVAIEFTRSLSSRSFLSNGANDSLDLPREADADISYCKTTCTSPCAKHLTVYGELCCEWSSYSDGQSGMCALSITKSGTCTCGTTSTPSIPVEPVVSTPISVPISLPVAIPTVMKIPTAEPNSVVTGPTIVKDDINAIMCSLATSLHVASSLSSSDNAVAVGWFCSGSNIPTSSVCTWSGVTCTTTSTSTSITGISLRNLGLSGAIPSILGSLSSLQILHLDNNKISGSIPSTFNGLTNLQQLWINFNRLTGTLPSTLGNLSKLQQLWLDNNGLIRTIPSALGQLSNLQSLFLNNNAFTGTLPSALGAPSGLQELSINNNGLVGSLPSSLCADTGLSRLTAINNQLSCYANCLTSVAYHLLTGYLVCPKA